MAEDIKPGGGNRESGSISWRSPSNIALVKYWGKRSGQVPENPSVSMTLEHSFTVTTLYYSPAAGSRGTLTRFAFEGKNSGAFSQRIEKYLETVRPLYPFLDYYDIEIDSSNSFPHSSGIASSASAMSALALCLTSLERRLSGSPSAEDSFLFKASYAARLGSGSAARSLWPGYVLWGVTDAVPWAVNEYGVPLNDRIHKDFMEFGDAILIVDESPKAVSSSAGHALMVSNPWSAIRYKQAHYNIHRLLDVLQSGDLWEFVKIVEHEAMSLHALMMSSDPGYILMKPATIEMIERIVRFRNESRIPVAFTLDAGPNVHLLYPLNFRESVAGLIEDQLAGMCSGGRWIDDRAGGGPRKI